MLAADLIGDGVCLTASVSAHMGDNDERRNNEITGKGSSINDETVADALRETIS